MATIQKSMSARAVAPSRRASVVVRASAESRRAVLGAGLAAVGSLFIAQEVSAKVLPWQESTGGQGIGKGSMPKSSTAASAEGYTMEGYPGTKKPSFIDPKKKNLLAKVRAQAEKAAN